LQRGLGLRRRPFAVDEVQILFHELNCIRAQGSRSRGGCQAAFWSAPWRRLSSLGTVRISLDWWWCEEAPAFPSPGALGLRRGVLRIILTKDSLGGSHDPFFSGLALGGGDDTSRGALFTRTLRTESAMPEISETLRKRIKMALILASAALFLSLRAVSPLILNYRKQLLLAK
jgi:hypothetical protein